MRINCKAICLRARRRLQGALTEAQRDEGDAAFREAMLALERKSRVEKGPALTDYARVPTRVREVTLKEW